MIRTSTAALLALLLTAPAAADVTVRAKMKSGGFRGLGAFEGTSARSVKGDKSRETSDIKYSGALMRLAAPPKDAVRITRVDLDKIWDIRPAKKSYTEHSISTVMKEATKRPTDSEPPSDKSPQPTSEEKPTHRIKKSDFSVNKTGEKRTINGFSTDETAVRMTLEVEEIATSHVTTYKFETDVWTTPVTADLRKAMDEEAAFYRSYVKKLGINLSPKDRDIFNPASVAAMLGVGSTSAENTLSQVKKRLDTIDGYPILTDSRWFVDEDPRVTSARKETAAKQQQEEDAQGIDVSGGVKGAAGSLLGGFAKKKMRENQARKEQQRAGQPVMSSTHEVLSVDLSSIPPNEFDVPAGFKKL